MKFKKLFSLFKVKKKKSVRLPYRKRPPLAERKHMMRTKLFGLKVLRELARKRDVSVLLWKVYSSAKEFSLKDFGNPKSGRIIVRTDFASTSDFLDKFAWTNLPRKNFLITSNNVKTEKEIRRWMNSIQAVYKKNERRIFIVHKVPELKDYYRNIQIKVNLDLESITIRSMPAKEDAFRQSTQMAVTIKLKELTGEILMLSPQEKELWRVLGSVALKNKVFLFLKELIKYAEKSKQPVFETSAVTYKEAHENPEFYDLLFEKR